MKVTLNEYEGCFGIDLSAETMLEASQLVRLGMNTTKELKFNKCYVNKDGTFSSSTIIAKHRRAGSEIPKRK